MRIVVAPQEFKGTLLAEQAAAAMTEGVRRAAPDAAIDIVPMADGGPGTVRAIVAAAGGDLRAESVHDPVGRPIETVWGRLPDGTAVIEMAAAAGLVLVAETERDPRVTSTYGVGELILAALKDGRRRMIIGLGGSATNDGGAGMAQALGFRLLDADGRDLPPGGAALARLDRIDASGAALHLAETTFLGATDVRNPLCGPQGASLVYGPQKGASPDVAAELDAALSHFAAIIKRDLGIAVAETLGAGSAGGLGAGLIAFLRADLQPGVELIAHAVGLAQRISTADLVLTGEGCLDGQTAYGKTPAGVARFAREAGVPVLVVAGSLGPGWETMLPLVDGITSAEDATQSPDHALAAATERAVTDWLTKRP